jgi:hypothetical protein
VLRATLTPHFGANVPKLDRARYRPTPNATSFATAMG